MKLKCFRKLNTYFSFLRCTKFEKFAKFIKLPVNRHKIVKYQFSIIDNSKDLKFSPTFYRYFKTYCHTPFK